MSKRSLHHFWTKLRPIRARYFLAGFLAFGAVFIYAYRNNNLTAIKLRDDVLMVDQQNGDIETALNKLRKFTYTHMNAELSGSNTNIYPPIQLKYRYDRLVQAEKDRVAKANAPIQEAAQAYCATQPPSTGPVTCNQAYVKAHGAKVQTIPDALYKFDFASPIWSPDLAGWSLLVSSLFLLLFVVRFSLERWLQQQLH